MIPGNWINSGEAVAAIVDPTTAVGTTRATWSIKTDDRYVGQTQSYVHNLGRKGDIIILGGDYDGNGITDSLILKQTTGKLGLRVNYFLTGYNGNNLGKERLYKALGAPFRDRNFFFSPDGTIDYLGVLRRSEGGASSILKLKPFSDSATSFSVGQLPPGAQGPLALKQGEGIPDLLAFFIKQGNNTQLTVKTQNGSNVSVKVIPGTGSVLVGDYLSDKGDELAVQGNTNITIFNPVTRHTVSVTPPSGQLISCVSNQFIY